LVKIGTLSGDVAAVQALAGRYGNRKIEVIKVKVNPIKIKNEQ
jgi:hypothetical protein